MSFLDELLLRKSRETVVIAGPVFVHLLNLISFLVTFQLVKSEGGRTLEKLSKSRDGLTMPRFLGRFYIV